MSRLNCGSRGAQRPGKPNTISPILFTENGYWALNPIDQLVRMCHTFVQTVSLFHRFGSTLEVIAAEDAYTMTGTKETQPEGGWATAPMIELR